MDMTRKYWMRKPAKPSLSKTKIALLTALFSSVAIVDGCSQMQTQPASGSNSLSTTQTVIVECDAIGQLVDGITPYQNKLSQAQIHDVSNAVSVMVPICDNPTAPNLTQQQVLLLDGVLNTLTKLDNQMKGSAK